MNARNPQILVFGLAFYAASTLISMAVMSVGAGVLAACLLWFWGGPRGVVRQIDRVWRSNPAYRIYFWTALVLTAACLLSLIVAKIHPLVFEGQRPQIEFGKDMAKAWYLFWPLLLAPAIAQAGAIGQRKTLTVWIVVFGWLSLLGITQFFTGWPRPQGIPGFEPHNHVTLFLGHHLSVASIFIFPFFLSLEMALRRSPEARLGIPRRWWIAIVLVGFLALFGTFSRMLWVALPVGILLWLLWALPGKWKAIVGGGALLAVAIASQTAPIQKRIHDPYGLGDRERLWEANFEFLKQRPLTGAGWHHNLEMSNHYFNEKYHVDGKYFIGHAHNNVIEMLGSTGWTGLVAWVAWNLVLIALLWKASRNCENEVQVSLARAFLCAWLVFQINGITQVNFWEAKVLHTVMWVMAWALAMRLKQHEA